MHAQLINLVLRLLWHHHNFKSDFLIRFQLTFFAKRFRNSFVGAKTNFLRLIFLLQRPKQYLPSPGAASDPFAEFLSEQRKRKAALSLNQVAKKPKGADQRTVLQPDKVAEDVAYLKRRLDEKNAECATLRSQVSELQRSSVTVVEALSRNQDRFSQVSRIMSFNMHRPLSCDLVT